MRFSANLADAGPECLPMIGRVRQVVFAATGKSGLLSKLPKGNATGGILWRENDDCAKG
jgi:hypothetical protein